MSTQLRIYWDGNAPGLKEGRLSIATFGPALEALLRAARNIARRQVAAAQGETWNPDKATRATLVDLQMSTYKSGSAEPTFDVVPLPTAFGAAHLINDLTVSITREMYDCIRDEARGVRRDRFINEFLHLLPKGLSRQRYSVLQDGTALEDFEVRGMNLVEPDEDYPSVVRLRGQVDGVTFGERGPPTVRFLPWTGKPVTVTATKDQVSQALDVRGKAQALFLMGDHPRLLWIRADDTRTPLLSEKEREDHIFERWGDALGRLSDE